MLMHYTTTIRNNPNASIKGLEEYHNASPFKRLRMLAARFFDLGNNVSVMKEVAVIKSANNHEVFKNFTSGKTLITPVVEEEPTTPVSEKEVPAIKLAATEKLAKAALAQEGVPGVNVTIVNGDHVFTKDNSQKTNICNLMFNKDKYLEKKAIYEEGIAELINAVKEGLTYDKLIPIGSKFRGLNRIVIINDKMNKEVKAELIYGCADAFKETGVEPIEAINAAIRVVIGKVLHDAAHMKATDVSKALYTAYMVATVYHCAKTMLKEQGDQ